MPTAPPCPSKVISVAIQLTHPHAFEAAEDARPKTWQEMTKQHPIRAFAGQYARLGRRYVGPDNGVGGVYVYDYVRRHAPSAIQATMSTDRLGLPRHVETPPPPPTPPMFLFHVRTPNLRGWALGTTLGAAPYALLLRTNAVDPLAIGSATSHVAGGVAVAALEPRIGEEV